MSGLYMSLLALIFLLLPLRTASAQWVQTYGQSAGYNVILSFAVSGTNLFAGGYLGALLSTDNGTSWTAINTGLPPNAPVSINVVSLATSPNGTGGTNLFAAVPTAYTDLGYGVYLSTNNGTSWTAVNTGLTHCAVQALAVSGTNLFAGTDVGGVFLSTNSGTSWTAVNTGLTDTLVSSLALSGTNLFAGTHGGGVFLSTNNATSWTAVNSGLPSGSYVLSLAVSGTNLFAGTSVGLFRSTNNGTNWTPVTRLATTNVYSFAVMGTNLFAGTYSSGVFLSTDNDTSWTAVNTGLPTSSFARALIVYGTNLFVGINGVGIWRRPLGELVGVYLSTGTQLNHYSLEQNYPNPFNPSTTIEFSLPQATYVSLKVYDVLGRVVQSLVEDYLQAGEHSVTWNAPSQTSGVYFADLNAGTFRQAKKMLLNK